MAINIKNIVISNPNASNTSDSRRFLAVLPSNANLQVDVNGNITSTGGIYFYAYMTTGYVSMPNGVWAKMPFDTLLREFGGSNYSTVNNRFTAPKTGLYLFTGGIWASFQATANSQYIHPLYYVNGSQTARKSTTANPLTDVDYKIRHYGFPNPTGAGVQDGRNIVDGYHAQMLYLREGDYVESWVYCNSNANQYYGQYSMFSGYYFGSYV